MCKCCTVVASCPKLLQKLEHRADGIHTKYLTFFITTQNCFDTVVESRIDNADVDKGLWNPIYLCQKWLAKMNCLNHTESQFRSFSTLTKAQDLDPLKQKKADVMGLRKSPRGVKPHPHTLINPSPPLSLSKIPPLILTLQTLLKQPPLVPAWICSLWSSNVAVLKLFF